MEVEKTGDLPETTEPEVRPDSASQVKTLMLLLLATFGFGGFWAMLTFTKGRPGRLFQRVVKGFGDAIVIQFEQSVIGQSEPAFSAQVREHAQAYGDVEPWKMVIPQFEVVAKYSAFLAVFIFFPA